MVIRMSKFNGSTNKNEVAETEAVLASTLGDLGLSLPDSNEGEDIVLDDIKDVLASLKAVDIRPEGPPFITKEELEAEEVGRKAKSSSSELESINKTLMQLSELSLADGMVLSDLQKKLQSLEAKVDSLYNANEAASRAIVALNEKVESYFEALNFLLKTSFENLQDRLDQLDDIEFKLYNPDHKVDFSTVTPPEESAPRITASVEEVKEPEEDKLPFDNPTGTATTKDILVGINPAIVVALNATLSNIRASGRTFDPGVLTNALSGQGVLALHQITPKMVLDFFEEEGAVQTIDGKQVIK
jgi:hypothetical protein